MNQLNWLKAYYKIGKDKNIPKFEINNDTYDLTSYTVDQTGVYSSAFTSDFDDGIFDDRDYKLELPAKSAFNKSDKTVKNTGAWAKLTYDRYEKRDMDNIVPNLAKSYLQRRRLYSNIKRYNIKPKEGSKSFQMAESHGRSIPAKIISYTIVIQGYTINTSTQFTTDVHEVLGYTLVITHPEKNKNQKPLFENNKKFAKQIFELMHSQHVNQR